MAAIEFTSVLRKLVSRGILSDADALATLRQYQSLAMPVFWDDSAIEAGFQLSGRFGHSDTFDTTGYALARSLNAEFWVSDRRFYNAATSAGLSGLSIFD